MSLDDNYYEITQHHIPNTSQAPITNTHSPNPLVIGVWLLELPWNLEFGYW
jgi:hypothetical protein